MRLLNVLQEDVCSNMGGFVCKLCQVIFMFHVYYTLKISAELVKYLYKIKYESTSICVSFELFEKYILGV